ncbi:MAG: alpha/beta fold hydrolase [Myxococcota bacterium]|nr:alpha/beta fold hydrolase [Myxococcota bacterium]
MKTILIAFLGALLALPCLIWLSAWMTLDRSFAHTRASEALPPPGPGTSTGLVQIEAGGFQYRARVAGLDGDGPALILLHGFPESSIMWTPLLERAAEAGFQVVAFDQRGYSPGARPVGVEQYAIDFLVDDVFAVADAVDFDTFHLIGHDWGSIVGWAATSRETTRILSWASLAIPHPGAIPDPDAPPSTPTYVKVFRRPGVAEALLGTGGRWFMKTLMYSSMPAAHVAEYDALYAEPGALTATLNWYRALDPSSGTAGNSRPVKQPVLYIYGRNDIGAFVNDDVQSRMPAFVEGPFETVGLDAGHWLIQDEGEIVLDYAMKHLERNR